MAAGTQQRGDLMMPPRWPRLGVFHRHHFDAVPRRPDLSVRAPAWEKGANGRCVEETIIEVVVTVRTVWR